MLYIVSTHGAWGDATHGEFGIIRRGSSGNFVSMYPIKTVKTEPGSMFSVSGDSGKIELTNLQQSSPIYVTIIG